jgi:hypothetical protein
MVPNSATFRFPGHWMCRLEPHQGWWTRSGVVSLAETGDFPMGIRVDFWSRTGWRYGHSHSNCAAFTAFLAIYNMCIYIYVYTCTFVKCLKPTSKDSKKNNKKRKRMRKRNSVWRKEKTKAKKTKQLFWKSNKKTKPTAKKSNLDIHLYAVVFFLIFAFVSLFFRFFFRFFFRRWPDDADVRKCKTLEEKNEQKKTKKTAAYKCILGLQFFFGFWFCFFLLFVSLLSCSDCFFLICL